MSTTPILSVAESPQLASAAKLAMLRSATTLSLDFMTFESFSRIVSRPNGESLKTKPKKFLILIRSAEFAVQRRDFPPIRELYECQFLAPSLSQKVDGKVCFSGDFYM
jgi:hypothetical protein